MIESRLYAIARAYKLGQLTGPECLQEIRFWTALQLWTNGFHKLLNLFWRGEVFTCATPVTTAAPIEV